MFKQLLIISCLIGAAYMACVAYDGNTGQGYLKVCPKIGLCTSKMSMRRSCVDLSGGSYYSGNSENSRYQCIIYSQSGCAGSQYVVANLKVSFPWRAMSFRCPYKC